MKWLQNDESLYTKLGRKQSQQCLKLFRLVPTYLTPEQSSSYQSSGDTLATSSHCQQKSTRSGISYWGLCARRLGNFCRSCAKKGLSSRTWDRNEEECSTFQKTWPTEMGVRLHREQLSSHSWKEHTSTTYWVNRKNLLSKVTLGETNLA